MSTPVMQLFDLSGQTALVTGGSRGLGLQIAEALGEAGARVVLTARKAVELEAAVAQLAGRGINATGIAADASDPAQIDAVVAQAMSRLDQRIDILVNNAGATWGAAAEDYPIAAWDKVMNLNIRSLFLFAQAVGKASMIPRRHGRIINTASIAGLSGSKTMKFIAYGTSKGAVVNFTRSLAGEWGPYGITVNAIAPGMFPSRMTRGTIEHFGVDKLAASAPLGRVGDDDDLKGAALLFASAAGKHITGQILAIDGGVSAVHGE
jgi:gluconate 5-dehydrogenase